MVCGGWKVRRSGITSEGNRAIFPISKLRFSTLQNASIRETEHDLLGLPKSALWPSPFAPLPILPNSTYLIRKGDERCSNDGGSLGSEYRIS